MPWVIEEASKRAQEYFQNHEKVEMVLRTIKSQYAPFEDLKIKWVDEVKEETFDQDAIRKLIRNPLRDMEKLDKILPKLDQIFKPFQNPEILAILNTALSAANLVATVTGTIIICNKLNSIDHRLDEIQKQISDTKEINYEMQIAKPCRKLVDDYKLLMPALSKGIPISEDKLNNLIRGCKDYIISIYNLRNNLSLDAALTLIFLLLPILTNCIMVYYQHFYDPTQDKHPLHDSCMSVFDLLSEPAFINQIQDYLFIDMHEKSRQVNTYLDCHRLIVYSYKKKIEQLLEDMKTCGTKEEYQEAILWTKQYVAQQVRVIQAELESKVGAEKAKTLVEQVMKENAVVN